MARYEVVLATAAHSLEVAAGVDAETRRRVEDLYGASLEDQIERCRQSSPDAVAGLVDGRAVLMAGVGRNLVLDPGDPWLIGTNEEFSRHRFAFMRMARDFIRDAKKRYHALRGFVRADDPSHLRFIDFVGLDVDRDSSFMIGGVEHHQFSYRSA